jgi:hypothetical protein
LFLNDRTGHPGQGLDELGIVEHGIIVVLGVIDGVADGFDEFLSSIYSI